jgi:hypothetical protein
MYAIVGEPRFLYIGHGNVLKTQFWRRSVGGLAEVPYRRSDGLFQLS